MRNPSKNTIKKMKKKFPDRFSNIKDPILEIAKNLIFEEKYRKWVLGFKKRYL